MNLKQSDWEAVHAMDSKRVAVFTLACCMVVISAHKLKICGLFVAAVS
jgi:hypothetical protein